MTEFFFHLTEGFKVQQYTTEVFKVQYTTEVFKVQYATEVFKVQYTTTEVLRYSTFLNAHLLHALCICFLCGVGC